MLCHRCGNKIEHSYTRYVDKGKTKIELCYQCSIYMDNIVKNNVTLEKYIIYLFGYKT